MEILQSDTGEKGKFYIAKNGQVLAEMTYVWAGEKRFIIDHTEVSEQLKGQSAGKQLLMKAVAYARANDLHILPLCPFAKSVFDKVADIRDVL